VPVGETVEAVTHYLKEVMRRMILQADDLKIVMLFVIAFVSLVVLWRSRNDGL
jgi:hypothetical protein